MINVCATLSFGLAVLVMNPLAAQDLGRQQDGFIPGQSNGQYDGQSNGQVNPRVDGRASHNEGLPPSAEDKSNYKFDNPIADSDCAEVNSISPDSRRGWQDRIRDACR